ncbi:MAG: hypothetical protein ACRDIZ_02015 [Actinomycetota bacterium]
MTRIVTSGSGDRSSTRVSVRYVNQNRKATITTGMAVEAISSGTFARN